MITDEQTITSEAVAAWESHQLAKALKLTGYAQISVEISGFTDSVMSPKASFRVYVGNGYQTGVGATIEECFDALAKQSPKSNAQRKREQAAALLAEAEKLESETN